MTLSEEYIRQEKFRDWSTAIETIDIRPEDTILDLGCGIGSVTVLLAQRARHVIGIDKNAELLSEAAINHFASNIQYLQMDLAALDHDMLPNGDGIWSSFVAAYFPDLPPILDSWLTLLKPGGWIALTEMSGLFSHEPLSPSTQDIFSTYYERQRKANVYDFEMGERLAGYLKTCGLKIILDEEIADRELTFHGPADPDVLRSWDNRFDRMVQFREYLGEEKFANVKKEFLECLSDNLHVSKTKVKFIIAVKPD